MSAAFPVHNFRQTLKRIAGSGLGAPVLVVAMLGMMILPMPPIALDLLFTFNIAFSLIIMLVVIYVLRPLEFAVFPTVLLVATLMRLALNVASTRVVLLNGHTGGDAAGKVIESFGDFVIGGNYAVGLVVFAILVIINFVVVTKGAGRVSEVTARFTLDAMPGKQMAIDADLNAGLIDADQARSRRVEIGQEADFYGAMDGASKFVRGDAIAGLVILFINIIGGLFIGMLQHDLSFNVAMENYALLTIGDGLVAQIPSLVLSTASAIIITRVSSSEEMGTQINFQLFDDPRPLMVTAVIMLCIGVIPGMPNVAFLLLGTLCGFGAWRMYRNKHQPVAVPETPEKLPAVTDDSKADLSWEDVQPADVIGLEVGYGLIPLVDRSQGGELMTRIKGVRKKLSQDWGFLVQSVHIHDNLNLPPNHYRINLLGVGIGEAEVYPNREMAIDPGSVYGKIDGTPGTDPAFGLNAVWIDPAQREKAQTLGYTVVDASTVIATHLSTLLQKNAHKLLGHDEAQRLLDNLGRSAPRLVEGFVPDQVPLAVLVRVLQGLLEEGVMVRDMRTIVETLADASSRTKEAQALLAEVRVALGRMIVRQLSNEKSELAAVTLDPSLEQLLLQSLSTDGGSGGVEPGLAQRLLESLKSVAQQQEEKGEQLALLVPAAVRQTLAQWLRHAIGNMRVLSYTEVPEDWNIKVISTVGA